MRMVETEGGSGRGAVGSDSVIQRGSERGIRGGGAMCRDDLREGARLPFSCVSWPAMKGVSLPVSAGSPQGTIVPSPGRDRD